LKKKNNESVKSDSVTKACNTCEVNFNSESQYQAHLSGQKHQRKLEENANGVTAESKMKTSDDENDSASNKKTKREIKPVQQIPCTVCNDNFNSTAQYEAHCAGQKHKKKAQASTAGVTMSAPIQTARFRCETCNITVNSSQQMDAHFAGDKHKAKVTNKEEAGNMEGQVSGMYFCRNCNVSVPTAGKLAEHIKTPEHLLIADEKNATKGSSPEKQMDVDPF